MFHNTAIKLRNMLQFNSGAHPASYPMDTRSSFSEGRGRGVKLTIHLHLVPRSWMCKATLPPPQYAFMVWCSVKVQGCIMCLCVMTPVPWTYTKMILGAISC